MADADKRIGENLQELRGEMSQASLATSMKERGWKWSQPTVAAIEKGERPLKLAEAEDLMDILGLDDLESLIVRPLGTVAGIMLAKFDRAEAQLREATSAFWDAQFGLVNIADALNNEGEEFPGGGERWMSSITRDPASVVAEVAPFVRMLPETVTGLPNWETEHVWAHALATGPYGQAEDRSMDLGLPGIVEIDLANPSSLFTSEEIDDATPTDPAE